MNETVQENLLKVEESEGLPFSVKTGTNRGTILKQKIRDSDNEGNPILNKEGEQLRYVEYYISLDGSNYINAEGKEDVGYLRVSYPARITEKTGLGKFLKRFGIPIQIGENVNLDDVVGKRVIFSVYEENGYHRIDRDSVIPE